MSKCIRLKNLVTILQHTDTKDAVGGPVVTYATLAEVFANVIWKTGKESTENTAQQGISNVIFTIRNRTDLDKKQKITFRNKVYDILSIIEIGRNHLLEIVTQQVELIETTTGISGTAGTDKDGAEWITKQGETWIWKQ